MFDTKNDDVEIPTTTMYIPLVLSRRLCDVHGVGVGEPCYEYKSATTDDWFSGVCNRRAKSAGFNAPIRHASLVRTGQPPRRSAE